MPPIATEARLDESRLDPRDAAAYPIAEAARYVKVPAATLRSCVVGRPYPRAETVARFEPLIHPPVAHSPMLSFWNLVEAHVLRALRTEHGVSLTDLREALRYAEHDLRIERLLLDKRLRTDAGAPVPRVCVHAGSVSGPDGGGAKAAGHWGWAAERDIALMRG